MCLLLELLRDITWLTDIFEFFWQVMDVVDKLFVAMFDSLNQNCKKDLEAVGCQYPFEPLKVLFLYHHNFVM